MAGFRDCRKNMEQKEKTFEQLQKTLIAIVDVGMPITCTVS